MSKHPHTSCQICGKPIIPSCPSHFEQAQATATEAKKPPGFNWDLVGDPKAKEIFDKMINETFGYTPEG